MKILNKALLAMFSLVVFFLFISLSNAASLKDFDGNDKVINDFTGNGKWTVVVLWASWCKVSNKVIHEYVDFDMIKTDYNTNIIGISMDGLNKKNEALNFISKHNIEFVNLIGEYQEIASMYSNLTGTEWAGTPAFLVYSSSGELLVGQQGGVPAKLIQEFISGHTK